MAFITLVISMNPAALYLLVAESVNSSGEIAGLGVAADGLHGFLATPNSGQNLSPVLQNIARPLLTGSARKVLMRRLGIRAQ